MTVMMIMAHFCFLNQTVYAFNSNTKGENNVPVCCTCMVVVYTRLVQTIYFAWCQHFTLFLRRTLNVVPFLFYYATTFAIQYSLFPIDHILT